MCRTIDFKCYHLLSFNQNCNHSFYLVENLFFNRKGSACILHVSEGRARERICIWLRWYEQESRKNGKLIVLVTNFCITVRSTRMYVVHVGGKECTQNSGRKTKGEKDMIKKNFIKNIKFVFVGWKKVPQNMFLWHALRKMTVN